MPTPEKTQRKLAYDVSTATTRSRAGQIETQPGANVHSTRFGRSRFVTTATVNPGGELSHRHDENPGKPQQHLAVRLRRIGSRDARGVFGEILLALGRLQWLDERPQSGALDPFHDR